MFWHDSPFFKEHTPSLKPFTVKEITSMNSAVNATFYMEKICEFHYNTRWHHSHARTCQCSDYNNTYIVGALSWHVKLKY